MYGSKYLGMTASMTVALILILFQTLFKVLNSESEKSGWVEWFEVLISIATLASALILGSLLDSVLGSYFSAFGPNFLLATFSAMMVALSFGLINSRRTTSLIPFIQSPEAPRSVVLTAVLAFIIFIMNVSF
ncbi:MAG: hypothetical protein ACTSWA_11840, partial [Candidatus Thorarchaeota archaeon]